MYIQYIYIINNVNFNDVPRSLELEIEFSESHPWSFWRRKNHLVIFFSKTKIQPQKYTTLDIWKQKINTQTTISKRTTRKKNTTNNPQWFTSKVSQSCQSCQKTKRTSPSLFRKRCSHRAGVQLLQLLLSLWHCIQQLLLSGPRFARHLKRWVPGILDAGILEEKQKVCEENDRTSRHSIQKGA